MTRETLQKYWSAIFELNIVGAGIKNDEIELSAESIQKHFDVMEWWKDGGEVEYEMSSIGEWAVPLDPGFYIDVIYRKKEPEKKVPLTAEDLPYNPWVMECEGGLSRKVILISEGGLSFVYGNQIKAKSYEDLQKEGYKIAPSHKGPWQKCEKEGEE